jgi:hypothetical protein
MNTGLWLEDYQLTYQAGGTDSDYFIIRNPPLFLADSARTWLEHHPSDRIVSEEISSRVAECTHLILV